MVQLGNLHIGRADTATPPVADVGGRRSVGRMGFLPNQATRYSPAATSTPAPDHYNAPFLDEGPVEFLTACALGAAIPGQMPTLFSRI